MPGLSRKEASYGVLLVGLVLATLVTVGVIVAATISESVASLSDSDLNADDTRQRRTELQTVFSGRRVYRQFCARCHGLSAEGRSGPPLVDGEISASEVETAVRHGIWPFMPAFGTRLSPADLDAVTDYVAWLERSGAADGPEDRAWQARPDRMPMMWR